jgi:probable HAF family extracellular repeat protein
LAQQYTITDLGTLGGESVATDISNQGQVVGYSRMSGSGYEIPTHAFIWSGGTMTDLMTLGGQRSYAYSINGAGVVVGYSYPPDSSKGGAFLAFLGGESVSMQNLGTLLGGSLSKAYGINNAGQITGFSDTLSNGNVYDRAFLWQNGVMWDIGTLGGLYSYGMSINDSGQVVGYSENANGQYHAFLWANGSMTDLGTLGGSDSYANRINNTGQVAGQSITGKGEYHAFLFGNDGMVDLGTLVGGSESEALGINDFGQVVGSSGVLVNGEARGHAFIWESFQGMQDLNNLIPTDSGWELVRASGINNNGQIAGWGYINGVETKRAFLLTPVEKPEVVEVKINVWIPFHKINPWVKWGLVPVALLSSSDFNAPKSVDRQSLTFGKTGDEDSLAFCLKKGRDVNHDGLKDLVCYFHVGPMGFQCGDQEGVLKGKTEDEKEFKGTDEIQIWPCPKKLNKHHRR